MKRIGNLFTRLTSLENLFAAASAASAGKRRRPDVAVFHLNLEWEVLALQRELRAGLYQTGAYRTFEIRDPKPRQISAAPFRDRVVHHALTRILDPIFERRFSSNSFACRAGFGTHAALRQAAEGVRLWPFVLKCDIRKYFASIDHAILQSQLEQSIKCRATLELAAQIIAGFTAPQTGAETASLRYFDGDTLFSPLERRRGLPLGNQTSQFFANLYLNSLDRLVDERLRPGGYVRYVDDFVLFDGDKARLREMLCAVRQAVESVRLEIHPGKSRIYRCSDGLTFLGWRIFPGRLRLVRQNVARFRRRLRRLQADHAAGRVSWDDVNQRVQAWIGHASHGDTWVLRERLFSEFTFGPGGRPKRPGGVVQQ